MVRLIRICTVCHSVLDFQLPPLWQQCKDARVCFRELRVERNKKAIWAISIQHPYIHDVYFDIFVGVVRGNYLGINHLKRCRVILAYSSAWRDWQQCRNGRVSLFITVSRITNLSYTLLCFDKTKYTMIFVLSPDISEIIILRYKVQCCFNLLLVIPC